MHRIALIGAGRIGQIHARNVAAHPGLDLAMVVDPSTQAAQDIADRWGAKASSIDEAMGAPDIDGLIIASATHTHFLSLKNALDAKRTGNLETLQIISNDPAPPPVEYIAVSGGLFKDMAIHDFDMARWMMQDDPEEVFAMGSCLVDPAIGDAGDIDTARTLLKFPGGRLCVISNSRRSGFGYDQRIEVFGSEGMLQVDNVRETTLQVWTEDGAQADKFQNFFLDRYAQAYRNELDHFTDVLNGAPERVTYADGVAALALAEAAAESLRTAQPVKL